MELIIGRKPETNQLKIVLGKQEKICGTRGLIPQTVSRQHFSLTSLPKGGFRLVNLNPSNETFVNNVSVESKNVTIKDKIEMGADRCAFSWDFIKELLPVEIDITPLRDIWETYEQSRMKAQLGEQKKNNLRGLGGLFSMVGTILLFVEQLGQYRIVCSALGLVVAFTFFILGFRTSSSLPVKLKKLDKKFQGEYICPHCKHFFGTKPYDLLIQDNNCPYCKAKYKK